MGRLREGSSMLCDPTALGDARRRLCSTLCAVSHIGRINIGRGVRTVLYYYGSREGSARVRGPGIYPGNQTASTATPVFPENPGTS